MKTTVAAANLSSAKDERTTAALLKGCGKRLKALTIRRLTFYDGDMSAVLNEQLAPEIVQALIAQAAASGLTVNDYLARLLGLKSGETQELALAEMDEEPQPNLATLAALQRIAERQERRPFTKSRDTVAMLREARAGAMWGYEPTE